MSNSATAALRRRAEEKLYSRKDMDQTPLSEYEAQRLLQELQVHQIELEMQNAELLDARDEMATALEKYTDLYDFAPVGYFTLDKRGVITAVNFVGAGFLGVERAYLLGRSFGQSVAADSLSHFTEFLVKVFASEVKESCEITLLQKDKQEMVVQIEAVADASGKECRVAIIDISVRRHLEEKLEILHTDLAARSAELEVANIDLDAFNSTVSHDLRAPLTIVNSYCQFIQEQYADRLDEECRGYLQEMYEGTLRMNRLIDTMLEFSRSTRVEINPEKVDLSRIVLEVSLRLKQMSPERRVTFRIAEGITAVGDAALLQVVLENLIDNAWKYSRTEENCAIEFGETVCDGRAVYYVRDNGSGFDMAHADKLFIPFQRLHGPDFDGYGIGLTTVMRVVCRHGGSVWAESSPGRGASFFFTLGTLL